MWRASLLFLLLPALAAANTYNDPVQIEPGFASKDPRLLYGDWVVTVCSYQPLVMRWQILPAGPRRVMIRIGEGVYSDSLKHRHLDQLAWSHLRSAKTLEGHVDMEIAGGPLRSFDLPVRGQPDNLYAIDLVYADSRETLIGELSQISGMQSTLRARRDRGRALEEAARLALHTCTGAAPDSKGY